LSYRFVKTEEFGSLEVLQMVVSRRRLFQLGQAVLASAVLPLKALTVKAAAEFTSAQAYQLEAFSMQTFQPLINSGFAIRSRVTTATWLTLLSVENMNATSGASTRSMTPVKAGRMEAGETDAFALHFRGAGQILSQGTYMLENAALNPFPLFIVPEGSSTYVAIFNRLIGPTRGYPSQFAGNSRRPF
jgi:hypothetical protein